MWEFGLPGRAGTEWEGCLVKGTLRFCPGKPITRYFLARIVYWELWKCLPEYPNRAPRVKTVPPLFHPNVFPSGTLTPGYRDLDQSLTWPQDRTLIGEYNRKAVGFDELYTSLPNSLRIPFVRSFFPVHSLQRHILISMPQLLHSCRLVLHFPMFGDPCQLEAYEMQK